MSESSITPIAGLQPANDSFPPDTTQRHPMGMTVLVQDSMFGTRELIYAKSAAALVVGNPVILSTATASDGSLTLTATTMPTAIAQGKPIYVAATKFSAADQYGWFIRAGIAPVAGDSALAADAAAFAHAAGRIGATGVGKQLVGINVTEAATKTVVKTCNLSNGSAIIRPTTKNTDGWFIGMPLTGTGVGTSAKVTAINTDGTVTVDVVSTATSSASVTGTFNDGTIYWAVCNLSNPASIV